MIGLQPEGDIDWSKYRGIMVVVEQRDGTAKSVSWQLLGESKRMAEKLDAPLMALVIGHNVRHIAEEAIGYGADIAYLCDSPELKNYRTRPYSRICLNVIREYKPEIVLYGATYTGRDLAGAIATHLPTGLTADSTMLDVDEERLLHASRPAFSEKMMATILCKQFKPQMATVRSGTFEALPFDKDHKGEIIPVQPVLKPESIDTEVLEFIEATDRVDLEDAQVIVAGGRGIGGPQGFDVLSDMAKELGGTVAATRAATDAGWIDHAYQVGQTGSTVRPKLYIAVGISGAVQHVVGMQNSDYIIAINKDPEAPIFKIANYGIVGDWMDVIPALKAAWMERKQKQVANPV
ncbi:electron transfer flavoprotein subunit alpha/FixB family protein [Alicyclobacillus sp. SO9]|nr:electron transfer flavoprotein subunit alpha/FixB family protein [Alicyclobacillus sp. SO9]QQE81360.1 electron transfer flavoprotein subunit alpha/FixB family protein [Alicyclobacillus sp. SO9]